MDHDGYAVRAHMDVEFHTEAAEFNRLGERF